MLNFTIKLFWPGRLLQKCRPHSPILSKEVSWRKLRVTDFHISVTLLKPGNFRHPPKARVLLVFWKRNLRRIQGPTRSDCYGLFGYELWAENVQPVVFGIVFPWCYKNWLWKSCTPKSVRKTIYKKLIDNPTSHYDSIIFQPSFCE